MIEHNIRKPERNKETEPFCKMMKTYRIDDRVEM